MAADFEILRTVEDICSTLTNEFEVSSETKTNSGKKCGIFIDLILTIIEQIANQRPYSTITSVDVTEPSFLPRLQL
jgi:hypothetical protein